MFDALDISASALFAQRTRMDTAAENMASMNVTHNKVGGLEPYHRRFVVLAAGQPDNKNAPGVHVQQIQSDPSVREIYDPNDPEHDARGMVKYPNVDMTTEYVNALEASRAYEANVTMMEVQTSMITSALRLLA